MPNKHPGLHGGGGMKILFLDIDGVLNRYRTKETLDESFGIFAGFSGIDEKLLQKFLTWLGGHKEIMVVLSSSWRQDERLREHLLEKKIPYLAVTPRLAVGGRGMEIEAWLFTNCGPKWRETTKIAILDDLNGDFRPVGQFLVQTSPVHGLQDKHLRMVERLLEIEETVKCGVIINDATPER
jgi:hypothetical protein